MQPDPELASEAYCYLTTRGRVTGQPHTIEIWFVLVGRTLYMLAGSGMKADWVRNLVATPAVSVRIATSEFNGTARVIGAASEEDALARQLLPAKYEAGYSGDLTEWRRTALPVAIDIE
jgi:deazaflavin-dependent oxidoreductase (nitroreductase family)